MNRGSSMQNTGGLRLNKHAVTKAVVQGRLKTLEKSRSKEKVSRNNHIMNEDNEIYVNTNLENSIGEEPQMYTLEPMMQ